MTPKEKAEDLVRRMTWNCRECDFDFNAKQNAIVAVDEVVLFMSPLVNSKESYDYWEKVIEEIEKL
jgi:hypothetical protein